MPEFEDKEFLFPDEVKADKADKAEASEFEIEIEDDTPVADRNRQPMPKELVDDLDKDDLEQYDEGVKQKLKQMRKVWHDERRAKESALREQQEAITLTQKLLVENKRIKGILTAGEQEYVTSVQTTANLEMDVAKRAYKDAYDSGDVDSVIAAQEAMQNASYKLQQTKNIRLPSLQEDNFDVQSNQEQYQQAPVQQTDYKLKEWLSKNPWFGPDDEMSAAALGLHTKLQKSGTVALGSDEYYSILDKTMRRRFSEYFGEPEEVKVKVESTLTRPSTVVAPATRSTASNKIKLKQSQVLLAKKLGITNEQYAQAALKLEN